ncbi:hypothetical protein Clacol_003518 [Clathrus columnatus]|uniref:Cytochrome P450 n=1 Tax=Clathrus columnatus TaxID=1419009 RepID=A0AAV5A8F2_9AGAM|nr:hypothetical protein Clacol_003518 [Clathrus columnatus]
MCDFNLFLNKAGYETLNNIILTKFQNEHFPYFQNDDGGWIGKGGTYYAFTNETPVNSELEIRTSIAGWNDKWMYLVSRFISYPPLSEPSSPRSPYTHSKRSSGSFSFASVPWVGVPIPEGSMLHCTAITRIEFQTFRSSVPSNLVLASSGYGITHELFEKIQNWRFNDNGKYIKELYHNAWRSIPVNERWWEKAFYGEIELRRAEAARTLNTLVYTISTHNRYSTSDCLLETLPKQADKHVLVPFGSTARKTILTDRRFNSTMGYALMTSAIKDIIPTLSNYKDGDDPNHLPATPFAWLFRKVVRTDVMEKYPPMILQDILNELHTWDDEGISDPFDNLRRLLIIPILRIVLGAEVLSHPSRITQTISGLMAIEEANGLPDLPTKPVAILPTIMLLISNYSMGVSIIRKKINRIVSGARLYGLFVKVVKERRDSIYGPQQDILQTILEEDREGQLGNGAVAQRLIMALFTAGGSSSSVYPWLFVFLCEHPKWKYEVENEVRGFLKEHVPSFSEGSSSSSSQHILSSLSTLDLSTWENSFPVLEKCLRETLRLVLINAVPRMNFGEDINLSPSTRTVGNATVKKDEFVLYLTEDAHLNDKIYSDPFEFDPARPYSNEPTDFLGWGAGLHTCTGQRLAKVIIRVVTVVLINEFDFELADSSKKARSEPECRLFGIGTPKQPVLLKYRRRHCKDAEETAELKKH